MMIDIQNVVNGTETKTTVRPHVSLLILITFVQFAQVFNLIIAHVLSSPQWKNCNLNCWLLPTNDVFTIVVAQQMLS